MNFLESSLITTQSPFLKVSSATNDGDWKKNGIKSKQVLNEKLGPADRPKIRASAQLSFFLPEWEIGRYQTAVKGRLAANRLFFFSLTRSELKEKFKSINNLSR